MASGADLLEALDDSGNRFNPATGSLRSTCLLIAKFVFIQPSFPVCCLHRGLPVNRYAPEQYSSSGVTSTQAKTGEQS